MNTEDMMDMLEEVAAKLNGNEMGDELKGIDEVWLKGIGLVVVFAYSDDNVELRGAVNEEIGCGEHETIFITPKGLLVNACKNEDCPHFEKEKAKAATIEAFWCKEKPYTWTYETAIPHKTFDIMEDGEKFCRGIVFFLEDVPEKGG